MRSCDECRCVGDSASLPSAFLGCRGARGPCGTLTLERLRFLAAAVGTAFCGSVRRWGRGAVFSSICGRGAMGAPVASGNPGPRPQDGQRARPCSGCPALRRRPRGPCLRCAAAGCPRRLPMPDACRRIAAWGGSGPTGSFFMSHPGQRGGRAPRRFAFDPGLPALQGRPRVCGLASATSAQRGRRSKARLPLLQFRPWVWRGGGESCTYAPAPSCVHGGDTAPLAQLATPGRQKPRGTTRRADPRGW